MIGQGQANSGGQDSPRPLDRSKQAPATAGSSSAHSPPLEMSTPEFHRYTQLIYRLTGIRIPDSKKLMLTNRVRRRLRATSIASFTDYFSHIISPQGAAEVPRFLDEITTNETYFYRDPHQFEWFGSTFLPHLVRQSMIEGRHKRLRVWSAACSTGEELYSIALEIANHRNILTGWSMNLLGTDISASALAVARAGQYEARSLRLVPPLQRRRHFEQDLKTQRWVLRPELRSMVTWKIHNLLKPVDDGPFDCILLKNVLIYFDNDSKRLAMKNILASLAPDGFLVLGPTEGAQNYLASLVRVKSWLYQRTAHPETHGPVA